MVQRFGGSELLKLQTSGMSQLWAFQLSGKGPWTIVAHPLWDPDQLAGILGEAYDQLEKELRSRGTQARIAIANTFDIGRRPVWVYERLLGMGEA